MLVGSFQWRKSCSESTCAENVPQCLRFHTRAILTANWTGSWEPSDLSPLLEGCSSKNASHRHSFLFIEMENYFKNHFFHSMAFLDQGLKIAMLQEPNFFSGIIKRGGGGEGEEPYSGHQKS